MRTLLAVILLLSIYVHLIAAQSVPPIKIATMATGPYRQSPQVEDASVAQVALTINTPASLAGVIVMANEPLGGGHWLVSDAAAAAGNFNLTFTMTLPHTVDTIYACNPLTRAVNDEGQVLAGTLVLAQRRGGCAYSPKFDNIAAVNASGAIIQNCPGCGDTLIRMTVFQPHSIPTGFISYPDGQLLMDYMLNRRAAILAYKANGTAIPAMYQQAVTATVIGTGKLDQGDFDALKQIASKMQITYPTLYDTSAQRDWKDLLANPTIDPCLNRVVGLYCERGRVHSIWIKYLMLTGTLDPAWGKLSYLKYLTLSENVPDTPTGLTGVVPTQFCSLTNLLAFQMEGNSITSVPDCLAALPNLGVLLVDRNLVTTLPSPITAWSNNMVWLTASANKLTAFPVGLASANKMVVLDLSLNPTVAADVSTIDWSSWSQAQTLTLHHMGLKGSFQSGAFNNMRNLQTIDLSFNSLGGSMPDFLNGVSIQSIDFSSNQLTGALPSLSTVTSLLTLGLSSNQLSGSLPALTGLTSVNTLGLSDNQFTGGIPDSWRVLSQLTALSLNKNKLSGPLDNIAVMASVSTIDLSNNQIVTSPKVPGDIGGTIDNFLPPSITTVNLDTNALVGTWSVGRLKSFSKLSKLILSNNGLQKFPTDLWSTSVTYLDVTNNTLSGIIPSDINSQTDKPFVTDFYFTGNPNLYAWPLPAWLQFSEPAAYVPSPDSVYECRTLSSPTSRALVLKADPSFTLYNGCRCAKGRFGKAPICDFVPINADISPFDVFAKSNETAIQAGSVYTFSSILNGVVDNATLSSAVPYPNIVPPSNSSTSTAVGSISNRFYPSITDSWYGQDRLTIGLSTYWSLDLTRNRLTNNIEHVNNDTSLSHFYFPPTGPQPVRVITVRLHISAAQFQGPANTIVVFNDTHAQQGVAAMTLNGHDWISKASRNTTFTSTKDYQARYHDELATLTDPWVVEIPVYSSSLSVYFGSRDSSNTHFVMTYTYDYACPAPNVVRQTKTDSSYRCRGPIPPLETYDIPLRIAVYVMVGVAGLNIIFQVAVLAWKWNSPIYRASSRLFVSMIFFFLAVMSGGAIQYALQPDVNSSLLGICVGRAWLTALPLAGILAVLLVKTWRLYKIFCSTKIMKVTNASDSDLMRTIGVICSMEIVLLIVFTVLKLSKPEESTMSLIEDPTTGEVFDRYRIVRCSHEDGFMPWMVVQLILVFLGMAASTWLSFKTRHIPTAFNESSHIMATCAILLFFFLMIVPLDFWLQDRPEVGVLLQGFGQAFLAFSITSMVLGPKTFIALTYSEQDQTAMTKEITTGPSANTRSSITNSSSSNLNNGQRPSVNGAAIAKTSSGGSSSALNKGTTGTAAERGSIANGASKVPAFGTKAAPVSDKPKQAVRPSFVTAANKTPQSTSMPAKSPSVAPSPMGPTAQPSPVAPATPIQIGKEGPSDLPNGVNGTHTLGASPTSTATMPIHFRIGGVPASPVAASPSNVSPPASPSLVPLSFGAQNDSALDFVKRLRMRLPQTGARGSSPTRGSPPASPVAAPAQNPPPTAAVTSAAAAAGPAAAVTQQEGVPSSNGAPAPVSRVPSTEGLVETPGEGSSSSAL